MLGNPATTGVTFLALAIGLLAGCASTPAPERGTRAEPDPRPIPVERLPARKPAQVSAGPAVHAAAVAAGQVGRPYLYGGTTPGGFDCSGLVHYAYGKAGVATPRTTAALWRRLSPVSAGNEAVGDILFFDIEGKISHVGVYLGDGRFVHAPSSGRTVSVASLDRGYYREAFIRAGRVTR